MNIMKRIAFFLVAALAMGMTACKPGPEPDPTPTPTPEPESTEWTVRFVVGFSEDVLSLLDKSSIAVTYTLPGETEAKTAALTDFQPWRNNSNTEQGANVLAASVEIPHVQAGTLEYQLQARAISDIASRIDTARTYTCSSDFSYFTRGNHEQEFSGYLLFTDMSVGGNRMEAYITERLLSPDRSLMRKRSVTIPYTLH